MRQFSAYTFLIVFATTLLVQSCNDPQSPGYEYMPDMYRSPAVEPYVDYENNEALSARNPVEGTIARGKMPYTFADSQEGYEKAGKMLKNPIACTDKVMEEGKELYDIFCDHCHGKDGKGQGKLVELGKFPPPPSYVDGNSSRGGKMSDLSPGKIYHTIYYGLNLMGSHASQIKEEDRWKIVHYVEKLQEKEKCKAEGAGAETENEDETEDENTEVAADMDDEAEASGEGDREKDAEETESE